MIPFELPPILDCARPACTDAASSERWISQLLLTNIQQAHRSISTEIGQVIRYSMAPSQRAIVLDLLCDTVDFVQEEYVKKLMLKPVPFSDPDREMLHDVSLLWQSLSQGYIRCLDDSMSGSEVLTPNQLAQLCYRAIDYTGRQMLDCIRVGYEFSNDIWQVLHELYLVAEEQGIALISLPQENGKNPALNTCSAVYINYLLMIRANPYELSRKQFHLVKRWLDEWSALVTISTFPSLGEESVPPLSIYLKGSKGLQDPLEVSISDHTRYLDLNPLSKAIRIKMILLQQGESAESLGLGKDCTQPACGDLLAQMHQHWCEGTAQSATKSETNLTRMAGVCFGLEAMHFFALGKFPESKLKPEDLSEEERHQLESFGHIATHAIRKEAAKHGFEFEMNWRVHDKGPLGMVISRNVIPDSGTRIAINQLIAVRVADEINFVLGNIKSIIVSLNETLKVSIRSFPGTPIPITIRTLTPGTPYSDKSLSGFLLPALENLGIPSSLILPSGYFSPVRNVEITESEKHRKLRLDYIVEKGLDFERVSFTSI